MATRRPRMHTIILPWVPDDWSCRSDSAPRFCHCTFMRCRTASISADCCKWCSIEAVDKGPTERPSDRKKRVTDADLLPDDQLGYACILVL
jgi:hypothetical protein